MTCCRGRLIFPITDARGHVRGFGARTVNNRGPKYVNSPDSPLFHKGQLLYGLAQARAAIETRGEAIAVEGYLDVLTLHQAGFTNTVSPLSTAVSTAQLSTLRPLAKRIVLLFDGDPAGQAAMTRVFVPAEESGIPVFVAMLPRELILMRMCVRMGVQHWSSPRECLTARRIRPGAVDDAGVEDTRCAYGVGACGTDHPSSESTLFLQKAEARLQFPAGSLSEALGLATRPASDWKICVGVSAHGP